jgi:hypothetical protein
MTNNFGSDKDASGPRLVISLTTTPVRIQSTREMLTALADQDGKFSAILLNIPHRLTRTGETYEIPEWMDTIPGLRINRCADYGPATKLLGALECESDPETLIVTVDDDVLYPAGLVAAYRRCAASNGAYVYCTTGFDIPDPSAVAVELVRGALHVIDGHLMDVQVAAGFGSCLYKRSFFDVKIFDVLNLPDFLLYSDDLYISNYLASRDIGIKTVQLHGIGGVGFWEPRLLPYGLQHDALHRNRDIGTNRERYSKSIDYLIRNNIYFLDGLRRHPRSPMAASDLSPARSPIAP